MGKTHQYYMGNYLHTEYTVLKQCTILPDNKHYCKLCKGFCDAQRRGTFRNEHITIVIDYNTAILDVIHNATYYPVFF